MQLGLATTGAGYGYGFSRKLAEPTETLATANGEDDDWWDGEMEMSKDDSVDRDKV